jgi:hypothetical protein
MECTLNNFIHVKVHLQQQQPPVHADQFDVPHDLLAETGDKTLEVFVTPLPSPSAAGASLETSIATAPYICLMSSLPRFLINQFQVLIQAVF